MYTVSLRFYRIPRLVDGLARKDTSTNGSKNAEDRSWKVLECRQDTGYGAPYAYLGALPMVFGAKFLDFHHRRCMGRIELPYSTGYVWYQQTWPTKTMQKNGKHIEMCGIRFSDLFDSITIYVDVFFRGFFLDSLRWCLCSSSTRPGLMRRSELPRVGETHGMYSLPMAGPILRLHGGFLKGWYPPFHTPSADHF